MARIAIGLPNLRGKLDKYAKRYGMVELHPVDTPMPRGKKLAAWREQVPPSFAFSVVLPRCVSALERGREPEEALRASVDAARELQARVIVLTTPPTVRPTPANRKRILALAKKLPSEGHLLAWHAMGMWETEDVMATSHEAGWLPIFDAAQEPLPPGPVAYTRIRALGHSARLGADRIALIAQQLLGRREAFVVVDAELAGTVKAGLELADQARDVHPGVPALFRPNRGALLLDDEEQ
jgi:hypothetical protein